MASPVTLSERDARAQLKELADTLTPLSSVLAFAQERHDEEAYRARLRAEARAASIPAAEFLKLLPAFSLGGDALEDSEALYDRT